MSDLDLSTYLHYFYMYMPSAILVVGAIVVMFSNVFARSFSRSTSLSLSMIFISAAFLFCLSVGHIGVTSFVSFIAELIILVASFFFMFLTFSRLRFMEFQTPEFYPLYLFSVAGFLLMSNANNLIFVLLGLEIGSLPLATIIALSKRVYGIEAGIKYFVSSALASIFFIFGILLFYLYTGNFGISDAMSSYKEFSHHDDIYKNLIVLGGVVFILAGLGFKISLVPWHSWMPDIYEASNPVIAGYISVVPKIAGFVVFLYIFDPIFYDPEMSNTFIGKILWVMLLITITLPNIAALLQKDIKRMLAFSSISHSGFALACIYLGSFESLALYWALFLITNLGAFALLWVYRPVSIDSQTFISSDYHLDRFNGFSKVCPIGALVMSFFMISLAGIPPFSIFWGKIFVVGSALQKGEIALALVMMLNSAIAVCYYLKPIVAMFFKARSINEKIDFYQNNATAGMKFVIVSCMLLSFLAVFMSSYVLNFLELGSVW
ncbi:NADH-quinone oxidoreductase subunit N [Helicobacter muridarum]|uniref:NADH-quinone oxidoreductase subunit N n=1 Tax=Helicobacter muridarum TaxID=216 RepID=A0A377PT53_9HELI|nr:NADH-quinone oxidoreductase subunit N [Helicobacter muridarum]TLD99404.1 NADH-quinone oxidoreductase subunit N [Helicobacter muridarum]STQ85481.1 NADH:ubiquinone oxidoreductase subunit N [Helicobacter muridarum]